MNIVLTRPLIDAENLMAELFKKGHKIIHVPTLSISSVNIDQIQLEKYQALIFTSANAVRNLNFVKVNKETRCFCVGIMTEKIARLKGFTNTISAEGTVNSLKNLIINSKEIEKDNQLAYICGDNVVYDLDKELLSEGFKIKKIINYTSKKITTLNDENLSLIKKYPPDIIFVYSLRSAESFSNIINNYALSPLMTQSTVMCISKKIADFFLKFGCKKIETFNPGEEIFKLEKYK